MPDIGGGSQKRLMNAGLRRSLLGTRRPLLPWALGIRRGRGIFGLGLLLWLTIGRVLLVIGT